MTRTRQARLLYLPAIAFLIAACSDQPLTPQDDHLLPEPATVEILSGQDQIAIAGTPVPTELVLKVLDADGQPLVGQLVNYEVTSGAGVVTVDTILTDNSGIARGQWILGPEPGSNTLEARVLDRGSLRRLIRIIFRARGVRPAPENLASAIEIISGQNQTATVETTLPKAIIVKVVDKNGEPVAGQAVDFRVTAGRGNVEVSGKVTDEAGIAEGRWTLGAEAGKQTVDAHILNRSTGNVLASVTFTATAEGVVPTTSERVVVSPDTSTLTAIGATVRLSAKVLDTSDAPVPGVEVTWSSTKPSIAEVNARGVVTALAEGSVEIVASAEGATPGTVEITVKPTPVRIAISPDSLTVPIGEKRQINAEAMDANGSPTATPKLTWTSLNPEIASVDSMGTITARAAGIALITITTVCCSADTATVVSVQPPAFLRVTPNTGTLTLNGIGATQQLSAQVLDARGSPMPDAKTTWSSTNPSIAEVSASGVITARGAGRSAIIATADGAAPDTTVVHVVVSDVKPLFADDFESYSEGSGISSKGANGFMWGESRNAGLGYTQISSTRSHSGTRSLRFRYGREGGGHNWGEQRFTYPEVSEFWVEYYWYVPDNYPSHTVGNNKFLSWWGHADAGGNIKEPSGTFQTWPHLGGSSRIDVNRSEGTNLTHLYPRVPGNQNRHFIDASHRGTWQRIRIHIRQSEMHQATGIFRLWRGEQLIIDVTNDRNFGPDAAHNTLTGGYLMGWDNTSFQTTLDFYIDDFRFYTSNPGW